MSDYNISSLFTQFKKGDTDVLPKLLTYITYLIPIQEIKEALERLESDFHKDGQRADPDLTEFYKFIRSLVTKKISNFNSALDALKENAPSLVKYHSLDWLACKEQSAHHIQAKLIELAIAGEVDNNSLADYLCHLSKILDNAPIDIELSEDTRSKISSFLPASNASIEESKSIEQQENNTILAQACSAQAVSLTNGNNAGAWCDLAVAFCKATSAMAFLPEEFPMKAALCNAQDAHTRAALCYLQAIVLSKGLSQNNFYISAKLISAWL